MTKPQICSCKVQIQDDTWQIKQLQWIKAGNYATFFLHWQKQISNGTEFVASLKVWQNAYIENSEAKWLNDYSQLQPNLPSSKKNVALFFSRNITKKDLCSFAQTLQSNLHTTWQKAMERCKALKFVPNV